jgi:spore coat-associated protein N
MAVLVIGGSVAAYSGASFNYRTANPANVFTAGNLSHSNSKDGAAILSASLMKPGDSTTGTVVITNDGDIDGTFALAKGPVVNTDGHLLNPAYTGLLHSVLQLKIEDVSVPAAPVTKYDGALSAFTGLDGTALGGAWTPETAKSYQFTVSFPNGAAPASNTTGDNIYKGSTCTVEFDWTSVQ